MPPGAKKRKALKKKQQQQQQQQDAIGTSTNNNGDNLHGDDEHGSQDDRGSDSTLSSPGSQGNDEFGVTKHPSAAAEEISEGRGPKSGNAVAVEQGTNDKNTTVEKSSIECSTQTAKSAAPQNPCGDSVKEVDSVSQLVISEPFETSTHSNLKKSDEKKEYQSLEKDNGKVATLPGSAAGTSRQVASVREPEAPLSSEEQSLLLPGPQAVRTSWLSCCGLFDAVTGSDR